MAQAYYLTYRVKEYAVFDYFFRKLPLGSGYAVFAGLEDLLNVLEDLHFDEEDLQYLVKKGFDKRFVDYLHGFHFSGNIYSCLEGEGCICNRTCNSSSAEI